jgi:hypothetical protein
VQCRRRRHPVRCASSGVRRPLAGRGLPVVCQSIDRRVACIAARTGRAAGQTRGGLFINNILGLKSASSSHPCPICRTPHTDLLNERKSTQYRTMTDNPGAVRTALLMPYAAYIVPTPLHVVLGICNRIIEQVFGRMFGVDAVSSVVASIKQTHAPGCGGKADVFSLNGREVELWLSRNCSQRLLDFPTVPFSPSMRDSVPILDCWMSELNRLLLMKDKFTRRTLESLSTLVTDIHREWRIRTGDVIFPKLHMLFHCKSFAEKHGFLGKFSEAQIESCHARCNPIIHLSGRNLGKNTNERLRRALADVATIELQPMILDSEF